MMLMFLKVVVLSTALLSASDFPELRRAEAPVDSEAAVRGASLDGEAAESGSEEGSGAATKLAEREADLAEREAALAEREADLAEQGKVVPEAAKLAEREADLAGREAALAEREADLAEQGKVVPEAAKLAAREAELARREAALTEREADLLKQDKASSASSAELAEREAALAKRELALAEREAELARQDRESSTELAARKTALKKEAELAEKREADLAGREAEVKKKEAELAAKREAELAGREAELKKKEAALTEKEAALQVKEIALMDKAPVVAQAQGNVLPDVDGPGAVVVKRENGLMNWTENYIEAIGTAVAPTGTKGGQAKALARRGATLDLQRNLLEFLKGVQIDSSTTMNDFMAEDRVRSEISGVVKNVEVMSGEWDGETYTVTGRIKLPPVRAVVAPRIPVDREYKEPKPKKSSGRYTGLILDVRHLPLVPSMSFRVLDEKGKPVYGMEFVDQDRYLQSGLCAYYNNINYAKGEIHVAGNPIVAKALKLRNGNVDIVVSNAVAAKIRGSSYDFRKDCKVIVVSK